LNNNNNNNRKEGFKLSKAWNPSTRLLGHPNMNGSGKSHEDKHREEYAAKKTK
jgi:hypothetical protein